MPRATIKISFSASRFINDMGGERSFAADANYPVSSGESGRSWPSLLE